MTRPDRDRVSAFGAGYALGFLMLAEGWWWPWYAANAVFFVLFVFMALRNWTEDDQ